MTGRYFFILGTIYGVTCGLCLSAFLSFLLRRFRGEQDSGPADFAWAALIGVMAMTTRLFA